MDVSPPPSPAIFRPSKPGKLPSLFRWILILAIVIGAALRITNVAPKHKAVSLPEAAIALRSAGYTPQQVRAEIATGESLDNAVLKRFQLRSPPDEAAPPSSLMTLRRLTSGALSLLALPLVYQLTRAHFPRGLTAILLLSLIAISPLQIAYAQEAQPTVLAFVLLLLNQLCLTRLVQFWQQRRHLSEQLEGQGVRRFLYNVFYGLAYGLSAFGVALCLSLFAHPKDWLGVLLLLLSWLLHLMIALGLDSRFRQAVQQKNPKLSRWTLWLWGGLLSLAIALNSFHVMSFEGWLKGESNRNLAIAQQIDQAPAPLITTPLEDDELTALLALSHHLPNSTQWKVLSSEQWQVQVTPLMHNSTEPFYLYRPSTALLEFVKTQHPQQLVGLYPPDLWRFETDSSVAPPEVPSSAPPKAPPEAASTESTP